MIGMGMPQTGREMKWLISCVGGMLLVLFGHSGSWGENDKPPDETKIVRHILYL